MDKEELKNYILKHFTYDKGVVTRDDRRNSLGSLDKDGYLIIKVKGEQFKAHRIAWLLCYGDFPKCELDHINRNRVDNRIENLRESSRAEQAKNSYHAKNPLTGVVGVYIDNCTNGLKKKYTTRYKQKTYRFYNLDEAVAFRKGLGLCV